MSKSTCNITRLLSELSMYSIFECVMLPYLCTSCWELEPDSIEWSTILSYHDDIALLCDGEDTHDSEDLVCIALYNFVWSDSPIWMSKHESRE